MGGNSNITFLNETLVNYIQNFLVYMECISNVFCIKNIMQAILHVTPQKQNKKLIRTEKMFWWKLRTTTKETKQIVKRNVLNN